MKKLFLGSICLLGSIGSTWAQTSQYKNAITYKFVLNDYNTLDKNHQKEYSNSAFKHVNFAGEVGYFRYLNKNFNVGLPVRVGSMDAYHKINDTLQARLYPSEFYAGGDLMGVFKFNNDQILKENATVAPYLTAGLGFVYMSKRDGKFDMQIPVGAGVNIKLNPQLYLQAQAEYRQSLVINKSNLNFTGGLVWLFGKSDEDKTKTDPQLEDTDKDGVINKNDDCPTVAGTARTNGCPDRDSDGIADDKDACPDKAGLPENQGCPDTDGDGLFDNVDKCPNQAGTRANNGCPEVSEIKQDDLDILRDAMKNVQFETGKATLKAESYPVLDKVASVLGRYPAYKLHIHGYTDNVGSDSENLILSRNRAKACYDYLVSKKIEATRLDHKGFGEESPIAPNDTAEGRAQNRRVEFILVK